MKNFKILLVDDDTYSREVLEEFLVGILEIETVVCSNGLEALDALDKDRFNLVLSDIRMPKMNGIDLLKRVKELPHGKDCPFILMTGFAELETAVQSVKYGATDYLMKPIDVNRLNELILTASSNANGNLKLVKNENESVARKQSLKGSFFNIPKIGKIGVFSSKFSDSIKTANIFHSDRSVNVLIEGESGTGKEVIAHIIHGLENDTKPFITVNCSAIASNLFESELFGYIGGAFSGARSQGLSGKFELAQGGTLFLDEIGEMPLDLQPKLLRALQDREIFRIGGQKSIPIDVRIITATNRNLKKFIEQGKFREDLYHRLNLGTITLSPLREQKESIVPLAQMILEDSAKKRQKEFKYISASAAEILENYKWNGNVRELTNVIDRIVLLYDAVELMPKHLSMICDDYASVGKGLVLTPEADFLLPDDHLDLDGLEKEIVRRALAKFDGNKTLTADYLGVSRSALRSRL